MEGAHLAWWAAGLGLGVLAVTQWVAERRALGVSGFVSCSLKGLRRRDASKAGVSPRAALLFLVAVMLGGTLAAAQRGAWAVTTTLGPAFESRFGDGAWGWLALFGGGILVGFGTRWAGGCTSGHGLSGCARLQPGSLVATVTFLAAAVGMTFALRGLG